MIDEIIKCGKDILGSIGIEFESLENEITDEGKYKIYQKEIQPQTKKKYNARTKYIYDYDYGKEPTGIRKHSNEFGDYSADEISFTLNPRK